MTTTESETALQSRQRLLLHAALQAPDHYHRVGSASVRVSEATTGSASVRVSEATTGSATFVSKYKWCVLRVATVRFAKQTL